MRKPEPTGDALFDRFWEAYPHKAAKPKALTAFRKLHVTEELLQTMLTAIAAQSRAKDWDKIEKKYIPHPTTWLNQRRWEDETDGKYQEAENSAPNGSSAGYTGCCTVLT